MFSFGPLEDFTLVTNNTMISIIDKKHRIWIHDWSLNGKFYEVLRNDEYTLKSTNYRCLIDMNEKFLCFTDCQEQLFIFSNCLTGRKIRRKIEIFISSIFFRYPLVVNRKRNSFTTFNRSFA